MMLLVSNAVSVFAENADAENRTVSGNDVSAGDVRNKQEDGTHTAACKNCDLEEMEACIFSGNVEAGQNLYGGREHHGILL